MAEGRKDQILRDMKTLNAKEFEEYFRLQLDAFPDLKKDTEFLRDIRENKDTLLKGYDMDKDVKKWKLSQKKDNSKDLQARIRAMQEADRAEQAKVKSLGGKKSKKRKSKKYRKKSRKSKKNRKKKSRNKRR